MPADHESLERYLLAQSMEFLREIGIAPDDAGPWTAHDVLELLHSLAKQTSVSEPLRLFARSEAMLLAGRIDEAVTAFYEVAQGNGPEDIKGLAWDRIGDLYAASRAHERAVEAYKQCIALRPGDTRTRCDLARSMWHLGNRLPLEREFGEAARTQGEASSRAPERTKQPSTVVEVSGLYVSAQGPGILSIQGRRDQANAGLVCTGALGQVAREACDLAWSLWQDRAGCQVGAGIRIHFPNAAIPKDGPSLGLAVYALVGAVLGRLTVLPDDALTGELDLRGRVLPVGGVEEKTLAAYLSGKRRVFLPFDNLGELGASYHSILVLHGLSTVDELER